MLSPEALNKFIVGFVLSSIALVYGSLLVSLAPPAEADVPNKCASGCPPRRRAGNFQIHGVIECIYTEGELYESRLHLGEYIRVCEITRNPGKAVNYSVTKQRLVTY